MPAIPRAPVHFAEILKTKVWGGRRLERLLGKHLPPKEPVGESWEVCDHPNGQSVVDEGPLAGTALHDLVARDESGLIGRRGALETGSRFPLIFKFVDATQPLSVQVHPDDAYAREHGGGDAGKCEAWCVLQAAPGSKIARGLKPGVTRASFASAIRSGAVEGLLNFIEVRRGDVVDIPAGTVHSLGAGVVVAEIQQNSDTTYRVWDWSRAGLDGKPRELHVDRALDVIRFEEYAIGRPGGGAGTACRAPTTGLVRPEILVRGRPWHERLVANDRFTFDRWTATEPFGLRPVEMKSFIILACTDGEGALEWEGASRPVRRGDTLLVPGAMKSVTVKPRGRMEWLAMSLPLK